MVSEKETSISYHYKILTSEQQSIKVSIQNSTQVYRLAILKDIRQQQICVFIALVTSSLNYVEFTVCWTDLFAILFAIVLKNKFDIYPTKYLVRVNKVSFASMQCMQP